VFGLLSQLAHAELESPRPSESAAFFSDVLGFTESGRDEEAIYLRAWGDPFHHSLVIREGAAPRLAHIGWRTAGQEQLEEAVRGIEAAGLGEGWQDAVTGHGPAYRFKSPGGHTQEVFWEVERFQPSDDQRSTLPIRAQRFFPIGAAARQIDHVTLATGQMNEDIAFYRDVLGSRFMECTVLEQDDEVPFFSQMSNNEQSHDLGLVADHAGPAGRSHHLAYWLDLPTDVTRAADVVMESGTPIEFGPGKHGHGENTYLYFREPGGHRIELFSGGYRNYQPDWEPRRWVAGEGGYDMFRNTPAPDSMMEVFPAADAPATVVKDGSNPWTAAGVS
jgi:catechol 2,3-dioxygenase